MPFLTPLRYPGGKRRLVNFIKTIILDNNLVGGHYAEPYAGGASIGLSLLMDGYVNHIYLNDLDRAIYAFWHSVLNKTDELCRLITDTPVSIDEWQRQREIQRQKNRVPLLTLGFSTLFLNRTNRSGIISGGVIGGKAQNGKWKLDCRFNKTELVDRIQRIARYRKSISLSNKDASIFIATVLSTMNDKSLIYFDPPYYVKGQQALYTNYYGPEDHKSIAIQISQITHPWIVSYDDVTEIRKLYSSYRSISYNLHYTAQSKYRGKEILFFYDELNIPITANPQHIRTPRIISE